MGVLLCRAENHFTIYLTTLRRKRSHRALSSCRCDRGPHDPGRGRSPGDGTASWRAPRRSRTAGGQVAEGAIVRSLLIRNAGPQLGQTTFPVDEIRMRLHEAPRLGHLVPLSPAARLAAWRAALEICRSKVAKVRCVRRSEEHTSELQSRQYL